MKVGHETCKWSAIIADPYLTYRTVNSGCQSGEIPRYNPTALRLNGNRDFRRQSRRRGSGGRAGSALRSGAEGQRCLATPCHSLPRRREDAPRRSKTSPWWSNRATNALGRAVSPTTSPQLARRLFEVRIVAPFAYRPANTSYRTGPTCGSSGREPHASRIRRSQARSGWTSRATSRRLVAARPGWASCWAVVKRTR